MTAETNRRTEVQTTKYSKYTKGKSFGVGEGIGGVTVNTRAGAKPGAPCGLDFPHVCGRSSGFMIAAILVLTSCTAGRPLKGGKAVTSRALSGGFLQTVTQSDNPAQTSRQDQESVKCRTYTLPPGTRIEDYAIRDQGAGLPVTNFHSAVLSAPVPVVEREETRARTELGAAQKDRAREVASKLASLRGVTWVGLGLFLFGLASLVWPPLKVVIGSITTSAAIILGGLALMVLPTLIVGNELFILAAVVLVIGAWFLAHRHGHLRGQLSAQSDGRGQMANGKKVGPGEPAWSRGKKANP